MVNAGENAGEADDSTPVFPPPPGHVELASGSAPDARGARPAPGPVARRTWVGLALVVLGLLLWAAFRFAAGGEAHSYTAGATPPQTVHLTAGHQYSIGVDGGVRLLVHDDLDPTTTRCTITKGGAARTTLALTPDNADTKATNQIATFVSPLTGTARVDCDGVSGVFVDNADDSGYDQSGLWLVLGTIALAIGLPLTLSGLRRAPLRSSRAA